jgi:hypothetical protein
MSPAGFAALGALAAVVVALAVLTALGAHRRGDAWPRAVVSALLFPMTWIAWYVRDGT